MYRVCENGNYRDMTPEEIAELEVLAATMPEPTPTPEEQIAELQAKLDALQAENEICAGAIEELAALYAEE